MTATDLTRSLIYLNLYDVDGLIDIARTNTSTTTLTPLQQQLIQRLAMAIVQPIAPVEFEHTEPGASPLFEGRVALAVYPLEPLTSEQPPATKAGASGVKTPNTCRSFYPRGGAPDGRQGHTFRDEQQHSPMEKWRDGQ